MVTRLEMAQTSKSLIESEEFLNCEMVMVMKTGGTRVQRDI